MHVERSPQNFRMCCQAMVDWINERNLVPEQIISLSAHESKNEDGDPLLLLCYYPNIPTRELASKARSMSLADSEIGIPEIRNKTLETDNSTPKLIEVPLGGQPHLKVKYFNNCMQWDDQINTI